MNLLIKVIWPRSLRIVWENTSLCSIRGLMMGPTFVMQHWELMAAMLKHSKGKSSFALGEKPVIPHLLLLAFWSAFWSFFCSPAFASRSAVKGWNGKRQSRHKLKTVHFTVGYFCPFLAQVKFIICLLPYLDWESKGGGGGMTLMVLLVCHSIKPQPCQDSIFLSNVDGQEWLYLIMIDAFEKYVLRSIRPVLLLVLVSLIYIHALKIKK